MGDMIVTCTPPHSRNHMAGVATGGGEHVSVDLGERHARVGGYPASHIGTTLPPKRGCHMPTCSVGYDTPLYGEDTAVAQS